MKKSSLNITENKHPADQSYSSDNQYAAPDDQYPPEEEQFGSDDNYVGGNNQYAPEDTAYTEEYQYTWGWTGMD